MEKTSKTFYLPGSVFISVESSKHSVRKIFLTGLDESIISLRKQIWMVIASEKSYSSPLRYHIAENPMTWKQFLKILPPFSRCTTSMAISLLWAVLLFILLFRGSSFQFIIYYYLNVDQTTCVCSWTQMDADVDDDEAMICLVNQVDSRYLWPNIPGCVNILSSYKLDNIWRRSSRKFSKFPKLSEIRVPVNASLRIPTSHQVEVDESQWNLCLLIYWLDTELCMPRTIIKMYRSTCIKLM